jgi:hypothetical protein
MNLHPALLPLYHQLYRLQRRWWWNHFLEGGGWIGVAGLLVGLGLGSSPVLWAGLCLSIGLWAWGLWQYRPSLPHLAVLTDQRLRLDERLSTSLEQVTPAANGMHRLLLQDTLLRLDGLDWTRVVHTPFPRGVAALVVLGGAAWLLGLIPRATSDGLATTSPTTVQTLRRLVQASATQANRTASPQWQALAQQASRALQQAQDSTTPLPAASLSALNRQLEQALSTNPGSNTPTPPSATPTTPPPRPDRASQIQSLQQLVERLEESQKKASKLQADRSSSLQNPAGDPSSDCHDGDCLDPSLVARIKAEEAALERRKANLPQANSAGGSGERAGRSGSSGPRATPSKTAPLATGQPLNLKNIPARPTQRITAGGVPQPATTATKRATSLTQAALIRDTAEPALPAEASPSPEQRAAAGQYFLRPEVP